MGPYFDSLGAMSGVGSPYAIAIAALVAALLFHWRRAYVRARQELRNHRQLVDNLSVGIYRSTLDGRQLSANPALVRLNGYESEAELLAGVRDIAKEWYVRPNRRDQFREILLRDGRVEDFVSEIYRHKTRERIWITETARLVRHHKTGKHLFYEGSVREITETAKRLQLEEMFQKLTQQLPGGLFQFVRKADGELSMPYASTGFRKLVRLADDDPLPPPGSFLEPIHSDDQDRFIETMQASRAGMSQWDCEFRTRSIDPQTGKQRWLRITATPECLGDGVLWHGYLNDISVRKNHEVEIEQLAFFDPLTNLPNRRMLVEGMQQALKRCAAAEECGALLFIDLDNFKSLNDTMGHETGDQFLKLVAERLLEACGASDLVARIGGDEFVLLLDTAGQKSADAHRSALLAGGRVLSALRRDFRLGNLQHRSTASVGVVVFDGNGGEVEEIMKGADMAMYKAKASGRNGLALFDPVALEEEADRFALVADLRDAISAATLELHYQPQIDGNGRVHGAEALLRWDHPRRGMIPPDRFVTLSEQFGLAEELARFVVSDAIATLKRWQADPATASLNLALNVGVPVISSSSFPALLQGLVDVHRIDPSRLTLEVTEHVMARDPELMARAMHTLKKIGVRLSLDDFGTGYSSLAYLKSLPFDELKIDGSFVGEIEKAQTGRALVKTIMAMARILGLQTVAEHVETERQQAFLRSLACDFYQGWLYSKALPPAEFDAFLKRSLAAGDKKPELQKATPVRERRTA